MPNRVRKRVNISMIIPFLVIALVLGIMFVNKYRSSRVVHSVPQSQQSAGTRQVVLFFIADSVRLGREAREIDGCENDIKCLKSILDELLNGPVGDFSEALPEGAAVLDVALNGNLATIVLNGSFVEDLLVGSAAEMLAVYSIVNTVCLNFPVVSRVQLKIEGGGALKHLDLTDPLTPDYTLEKTPEANVTTVPAPKIEPAKDKGKK